jgi:DNA polymerase-3 subunit delta'
MDGSHPDLTWVSPSGAHEILVSDVQEPVVVAATRTPFESSRRVFVIERADELGDEAANRMLKTLEEPPAFAHFVLITDRLAEVLPTIRSRCQLVRFQAPSVGEIAAELEQQAVASETARAMAALCLSDAGQAHELVLGDGPRLRDAAQRFVRATLAGGVVAQRPWLDLLEVVRARGQAVQAQFDVRLKEELELCSRRERKRTETELAERARRARRRAESRALALGLQIAALWLIDLVAIATDAPDLVRNSDRLADLAQDGGRTCAALAQAVGLIEDVRQRLELNVSEELALESLAYRLERVLSL